MDDLTVEDRKALVESFLDLSTGNLVEPWYEPGIGFTIKPGETLEVWESTFTSNELGFRAGPVKKERGVFRVVFVGDSWTYGMGAEEADTFPKQFEALANRCAGQASRIEAWNLSLPGYNTFCECLALESFFQRLEPDAVVICPTNNDNDTVQKVLPGGHSMQPTGTMRDHFGQDHSLVYHSHFTNSFRYESRWRMCFDALRNIEIWLQAKEIPLFFFFIPQWEPALAHHYVTVSGLESPYLVAPWHHGRKELVGTSVYQHGSPLCYAHYARLVHGFFEKKLGWNPADDLPNPLEASIHENPPPGDWESAGRDFLNKTIRIPPTFRLPVKGRYQCPGPIDPFTGLMSRSTTILIRKSPNTKSLRITVRRHPETTGIYPLPLTVTVPSVAGGGGTTVTIPEKGAERMTFDLDMPGDIQDGTVMDVEFRAARATLAPKVKALRSLFIESIEQY